MPTSNDGAAAIAKIASIENQNLFLENLDEVIKETDKDTEKIYEGDTTIDLFNLFRECFFYYNLIERLVEAYDTTDSIATSTGDKKDEDIVNVNDKKKEFASFVKSYKNLTEVLKIIESSSAMDDKLQNLMNGCKIVLQGDYGNISKKVTLLNKILSEVIVKKLKKIYDDRRTAIATKSSSIVRVYYPNPDSTTSTPTTKKSKNKIREDVIKIDYNNTECTDKFNCALHQTMLRTDDYLKSVLNTFNNVNNPKMKKSKQIYTSYFDDPKKPYYLVWDDDKNLGRQTYNLDSVKGGSKKNNTKKKYK
jgi:hypothetical protein